MKKRSAIWIAAGLSLAMVTAAFGIVMGFTGPSEAGGKVAIAKRYRTPVVETVTKRQTVHVPAPGGSAGTTTVVTRTPAPDTSVAGDDTVEDAQMSQDEGEDHEDREDREDHESESPEPTETHSESESPEPESDD